MVVKTFAVLLSLPVCAVAADAKPAPKPPTEATAASVEFLEYLGSLESDDDNWTDFEAAATGKQSGKQPDTKAANKAPVDAEKAK